MRVISSRPEMTDRVNQGYPNFSALPGQLAPRLVLQSLQNLHPCTFELDLGLSSELWASLEHWKHRIPYRCQHCQVTHIIFLSDTICWTNWLSSSMVRRLISVQIIHCHFPGGNLANGPFATCHLYLLWVRRPSPRTHQKYCSYGGIQLKFKSENRIG